MKKSSEVVETESELVSPSCTGKEKCGLSMFHLSREIIIFATKLILTGTCGQDCFLIRRQQGRNGWKHNAKHRLILFL